MYIHCVQNLKKKKIFFERLISGLQIKKEKREKEEQERLEKLKLKDEERKKKLEAIE